MSKLQAIRSAYALWQSDSRAETLMAALIAAVVLAPFFVSWFRYGTHGTENRH